MDRRSPRAADTTGGSDEREGRSLNVPLRLFELREEAERLRAEQAYVDGDRNARTLAKVGAFRTVLVVVRSGARFDERDQRGSLAIQVLEGRVSLRVDDDIVEIGEGAIAVVAADHPWAAVALLDGLVLLHLAWPPEPGSINSPGDRSGAGADGGT